MEKNLGNSVDDGVRDKGGMCCKAFLEEEEEAERKKKDRNISATQD